MENKSVPLISVIVPIYNVEKFLPQCIDSIIKQTYTKLEIILVDDGATDASGCICDKYAKLDKRIIVIHKTNGGLSDARNAGIDVARGEFIAFVDSDDYIDENMYELMYKAQSRYNADIVRVDYRMVGGNKYKKHSPHYPKRAVSVHQGFEPLKKLLLDELHLSAWDKLFRRSYISNTRFAKGMLNEDVRFLFDILKQKGRLVEIQSVCYNYRVRPGSITNSNMRSYHNLLENANYFIEQVETCNLPCIKEVFHYQYSCYVHFCYACLKKNTISQEYTTYKNCKNQIRKGLFKALVSRRSLKSKLLTLYFSLK